MSIYKCLISESRRLWDYPVQPVGFTEQEACSEPPQTFYFLSRVVFLLLTPLPVGGHSRQLCSVCRGFVCFLQIHLAPVCLWLLDILGFGFYCPRRKALSSGGGGSFISNILSYSPSCFSKHFLEQFMSFLEWAIKQVGFYKTSSLVHVQNKLWFFPSLLCGGICYFCKHLFQMKYQSVQCRNIPLLLYDRLTSSLGVFLSAEQKIHVSEHYWIALL